MYFDNPATALTTSIERLGEQAGRQYAAMARPGFRLERPTGQTAATGQCRLGGPALLNPETAWPQAGGFPLSLHAILDSGALAGWLGDALPTPCPGLLNFFYSDPDVPYETLRQLDIWQPEACRVVLADPARAVETAAPAPARAYPAVPVHAAGVTMLPDSWDVGDEDVEFDSGKYWGAASLILDTMADLDGNTADQHCAFGWPDTSYASRVTSRDTDGPAIHLLQLARDAELGWSWGDAATLYFTIPAKSYWAGDFTAARLTVQCC